VWVVKGQRVFEGKVKGQRDFVGKVTYMSRIATYCIMNPKKDYPSPGTSWEVPKSQSGKSKELLGLLGTSWEVPEARHLEFLILKVPRSAGTTWDTLGSPRCYSGFNNLNGERKHCEASGRVVQ